jgi:pyrroloquinoline-quinone synthase
MEFMNKTLCQANHAPLEQALIRTPSSLVGIAGDFANRLLAHPFLQRCSNGTITRQELNNFLIQQGRYSQYFTRYLCALIANLENSQDVRRLLENLAEESGYDDESRKPHSQIYAEMMSDLGVDGSQVATLPETQFLIDSMFMLCRQRDSVSGLAAICLGAEAIVPSLYTCLVQGFVSQGVAKEKLDFFTIHIECDDGHADTMFDMLAERIQLNTTNIAAIQAGEIIINARLRMFDALLEKVN